MEKNVGVRFNPGHVITKWPDPGLQLQHDGAQQASIVLADFDFVARTKALMNFPSTCGASASTSRPFSERNSRASATRYIRVGSISTCSNPADTSLSRYSPSSRAPSTQPTQRSMFWRICASISPRVTTSQTASRPPGFSTRKASRNTRSLSAERLIAQFEMMTSTELSGSGICSISPFKNSTLSAPALRLFSFASASISSVISRPYAWPVGPTRLAESKTSMPPPEPRSRTTSPGFNLAKAVGFPQPSEACSASPGTCCICVASYRLEVIGSQADPVASAVPQQLPLFPRSAACPYFSLTISLITAPSMPSSWCPAPQIPRNSFPISSRSVFSVNSVLRNPRQSKPRSINPGSVPIRRATGRPPQYPAASAPCSACNTPNRETATVPAALPYLPYTAKTCSPAARARVLHSSACPNDGRASNSASPVLPGCHQPPAPPDAPIKAIA